MKVSTDDAIVYVGTELSKLLGMMIVGVHLFLSGSWFWTLGALDTIGAITVLVFTVAGLSLAVGSLVAILYKLLCDLGIGSPPERQP
jgi:hypothetical protein